MGGDQVADSSIFTHQQNGAGIDTASLFRFLGNGGDVREVRQGTPTSGGSLADQILRDSGETPDTRPVPAKPAEQQQRPADQRPAGTQQRPAENPVFGPPQEVQRPADVNVKVEGNKVVLSYNDAEFDKKLWAGRNFDTIKITDMPANVTIRNWVDEKGYFFYFQNGADGSKRHYLPANAKAIEVNNATQDLTLERMKVNDAFAKQHGGFQSMAKGDNVLNYLGRMSRYGSDALAIQEKSLTESAANSTNPYFKIYLADIHVAKAMKPIIDQMMQTGSANPNNPATLAELNKAIELLQTVGRDSRTGLGKLNRNPPQNVVMPLDPYDIYRQHPDGYYLFWGGSRDQAWHRELQITMLRDLIRSNALPKFELPPALPPR